MEYIEREKVIDEIDKWLDSVGYVTVGKGLTSYGELIGCLEDTPAADVVEVKYSNWELKSRVYKMLDDVDEEFYVECPLCHRTEYVPFELEEEKMLQYARKHYPYCHCGAKMDGKE